MRAIDRNIIRRFDNSFYRSETFEFMEARQKYLHRKKCLKVQRAFGFITIILSLLYLLVSFELTGFIVLLLLGANILTTKETIYMP